MRYNLLLNTSFNDLSTWECVNCTYKDGYLYSTSKVFGIEQELTLPNISKLYFRTEYKTETASVTNIKIGVQSNKVLDINEQVPKYNKLQTISLIDIPKSPVIKVHIIFESSISNNKVFIQHPILVDLNRLNMNTILRWKADKVVKYREESTYQNLLNYNKITVNNFETTGNGTIVKTLEPLHIDIDYKLERDKHYLLKISYNDVNDLGNTYIRYGVLKSVKVENQSYLVFKATADKELSIDIVPNDVLPYVVNLKNILLIDLDTVTIDKEDVLFLPYI